MGPAAEEAEDEDTEAIAQAHVNAVAGACLAVGIKYAGSANAAACGLLTHYCGYFQRAKHAAPDSYSGPRLRHSGLMIWHGMHPRTSRSMCSYICCCLAPPEHARCRRALASSRTVLLRNAVHSSHIAQHGAAGGRAFVKRLENAALGPHACSRLHSGLALPAGGTAAWGRLDKAALEACLCTAALALATVMAGSGHLPTLRLLRGAPLVHCSTSLLSALSTMVGSWEPGHLPILHLLHSASSRSLLFQRVGLCLRLMSTPFSPSAESALHERPCC